MATDLHPHGARPRLTLNRVILLVALVVAAAVGVAPAQDCVEYDEHLRWLTEVPLQGDIEALAMEGTTAFALMASHLDTPDQLLTLDLSDPLTPAVIDSVELPARPTVMALEGGIAYVGCNESGGTLVLIDVSDPGDLQILGNVGQYGVTGVTVADGYAYYTNGTSPAFIADVSDPTAPELLSWFDTGNFGTDTCLLGDILYVTDYDEGVLVVDVSDPATPVVTATVPTPGPALNATLVHGQLYISMGAQGVCVLDISDPWHPEAGVTVLTYGHARRISVAGDQAFVVDTYTGVFVLDVADPAAPVPLGTIDSYSYVVDVVVQHGRVWLAAPGSGVAVFDYPGAGPVALLGQSLQSGHEIQDAVLVDGMVVMLASGPSYLDGLEVLDVSDPAHPVVVGSLDDGYAARDIAAGDHCVYLKDFTHFRVIDLADPTNPVPGAQITVISHSSQMERAGELVYIAAREDGVQVIDVSDRDAPYLRTTLHATDVVDGIEAQGAMVYVADGPRLGIYSFADPDAPILVNTVELPFDVAELEFDRGMIYACGWNADLLIIDVTPPSTPAVVGTLEVQRGPRSVLAHEGLLYVADTDLGIHVLDATDPAAPVYLGTCDTPGSVEGMVATDGAVCAAMTRAYGPEAYLLAGLVTLPLQCAMALPVPDEVPTPAATLSLAVQPNPFNPATTVAFTLGRAARVRLGVHDLAGRRLAVLAEGEFAAGSHRLRWDGRDAAGHTLPSGTYFVRAVAGGEVSSTKVTLVK